VTVALAEWKLEHGDAMAFLMVTLSTAISGVLAWYMNVAEMGGQEVFVTEVFGTRLYLTAVGTGVLLTGLIAGEVHIVSKLERTRSISESVVIFSFALLSGMLAMLFTQTFAYSYFPVGGGLIVLIVSAGIFVSIYLTFLVLIGEYSEGLKNLLLIIFSGTIGAFFSLLIPASGMVVVLLIVVGIDVLMTYIRGRQVGGSEPLKLSVTTRDWGVGMGDLIVFAMVTDKALVASGFPGYFVSLGLLTVGFWGAMELARSGNRRLVPGTLLAALPAALPIFLAVLL
jgi:hypothetical protein